MSLAEPVAESAVAQGRAADVRRGPSAGLVLAGAIVLLALALAVFGPELIGLDPLKQNLRARNLPPSALYWLGTDHLGRDIAVRMVTGLRVSLIVAGLALLVAVCAGAIPALGARAAGPAASAVFFGFVDLLRAKPGVLLALVLVAAFGAGLWPVSLAVGLTFAPTFALIARAAYDRETGLPYVEAMRALGASPWRIAFGHILPNIIGPLITMAAIVLPRCIVTESVMSFLGLGTAPDQPTWGRMVAQAARFFETAPHAVLAPTVALSVLTLAFAILGTAVRRWLDPARTGRVA